MMGNLRPEKNYVLALQALAQLPPINIQVDIYGDGVLRNELEELIAHHQLNDVVKLKGRTPAPYQILPNYDLYLAASAFEGFGIALAEAMAMGLPCLVSDIPAHKEVGGDTVIYFASDSITSLKEKLNLVLNSLVNLEELSGQSRQRAKLFQKSNYLEKLSKIYKKQLAHD